jgi:hypothetical protein
MKDCWTSWMETGFGKRILPADFPANYLTRYHNLIFIINFVFQSTF